MKKIYINFEIKFDLSFDFFQPVTFFNRLSDCRAFKLAAKRLKVKVSFESGSEGYCGITEPLRLKIYHFPMSNTS